MTARHLTPLIAALGIAVASQALAQQLGVGGAPTGHRHKLRPVPARPHPAPNGNSPDFGDPLVGLSASETAAFLAGREEFESVETVEGGLGPIYNNDSCAACHSTPVSGGVSATTVTRFGRRAHGRFDPLENLGGSLQQQFATVPAALEQLPPEANVVARRLTTPLFGAGLIEAIPDAEILTNAARRQPDGVSGRAARIVDVTTGAPRIGRLGWKAQHATLLGFAGDAYLNEMGVTNRFFPAENAPNGNQALLASVITTRGMNDPPDPLTGRSDIDASADFMRLLAPPTPLRMTASALAGQQVFEQAHCNACHTPTLTTGPSTVQAIANRTVALYSDLLLHDMGSLGDGIEQGAAKASEIKTAPLWGLRIRAQLLHDGRAATVNDAVLAHDGEAAAARERYRQLSPADARALLDFLDSI
ncbi:MAG TPA: di-heme oxidoredictase family protein [Burkholderiaceae bacterium]|jgi:CxxC motif-containing protein (DUF1111 family)